MSSQRTLNNITINVSLLSQGSYQIESVVNKKKTVVTRTQHEVERLYNVLQLELKNHIIPSFPTCSMDLKFLLEKLTNFFNNLLNINDCLTNVNFLSFLESEFLFNPVVGNSINPGLEKSIGNNKSFFNFFGGGSNTQDNDVYFENALKLTNQIDIGIIEIGKLCEKLARSEKSYSIHCSDLVTKFGVLAEETSPVESYQMLLKKFVKCMKLTEDIHSNNANYLASTLFDFFCYQSRFNFSALTTFNYRLSLLSEYEQQCKVTQKKIQNLEKLKSSSSIKTDKVDVASNELFEVKKTETEVKDTLTSTSETIKREYDDFKFLQDYELGAELDKFVGKQLQVNKNLLKVWDNILKDLESLY
ncbi:Vacuolar protein sorting-associated protein 17 [Lobulomyces angularis]|nr:Vacuolar protein sorting-associated protein 17 [Lobulomyces angularis]